VTAAGAGVFALLLVLTAPAVARASEPTTVVAGVDVVPPNCPIAPLSLTGFMDALRVELAGQATAAGGTSVTLAIEPCDPATNRVQVTVAETGTQRASGREIDLGDVAESARPRALALAVAELVRAMRQPAAAPPPPPAPPPQPAVAVAPSLVEPLTSTIAGDALYAAFVDRDTSLWGGRLSLSVERGHWHLGVFGEFLGGSHGYEQGHVTLQTLNGGVVVGPRWVAGRLTFSPGVAGTFGWAHIDGSPSEEEIVGRSGDGVTASARARLLVSWAVGATLAVRALVEGGWTYKGFDALVEGARAAGLSGSTLVLGLGLGGFGQ
jgi:hypothetical protein